MTTNDPIDRLRSLRVADVMHKHVVTVGANQTMFEVANLFLESNIAAAPVIDANDRFVGILSATDFLRRDSGERDGDSSDTVSSFMTKQVQTVSLDTSLLRAALLMSAEHIHRLPVLDERNRVAGVISTMDLTAAVVNIVDEFDARLLNGVTTNAESE